MESEMMCHVTSPVNFEISRHPLTMRRVVNLVIAMERLKNSTVQSLLSPDFRDENLLSFMLESIVEERIVSQLFAAKPQFTRMPELEPKPYYSVTDSEKRDLVLAESSMKLHAVMLQGGSNKRKVQLNMSTYRPPVPSTVARPVALGIRGTDYYLCCHTDGNQPSLHIETVSNKDLLTNISTDSEMVRFIFYKHDTGLNLSSMRSALFPEWYISTAEQDDVPVQMRAEASTYNTLCFQRQN